MSKINYAAILNEFGEDYVPLKNVKFETKLGKTLMMVAQKLADELKANLSDVNSYMPNSLLNQSIAAIPVSALGGKYIVAVQGNYYAFYVNSGVSGTQRKFATPYSFKNDKPAKAMVNSIAGWISQVGIPLQSRYANTKSLSRKKRRATQEKEKRQMAYAMAVSIKRKGLKPTLFIDKTVSQEEIMAITNMVGDKFTKQVVVSIDKTWQLQ